MGIFIRHTQGYLGTMKAETKATQWQTKDTLASQQTLEARKRPGKSPTHGRVGMGPSLRLQLSKMCRHFCCLSHSVMFAVPARVETHEKDRWWHSRKVNVTQGKTQRESLCEAHVPEGLLPQITKNSKSFPINRQRACSKWAKDLGRYPAQVNTCERGEEMRRCSLPDVFIELQVKTTEWRGYHSRVNNQLVEYYSFPQWNKAS